jgi:hypothetical protein
MRATSALGEAVDPAIKLPVAKVEQAAPTAANSVPVEQQD